MSEAVPGRAGRSRLRKGAVAGLLLAGLVAAAWLASPPPSDGLPLSPGSASADGTMALTEILEELGTEVALEATPPEAATTGLLLVDNIGSEQRDEWRELARRGGTLVVVDPRSELAPDVVGETTFGFLEPPVGLDCEVEALAGAGQVQAGGGLTFSVPDEGVGCFRRGGGAWLVAEPEGDGVIVSTGGPQFLTNQAIGEADNAVLATALLAPRAREVVAIAPPDLAAAEAETAVTELVPDGAWSLMAQLLVAFVVVLLWRSRRLGAPVVETQPVALPGSELVMGVGRLFEQTGSARHAAGLLRQHAHRTSAARLRLPPGASAAEVAEAAVAAGLDRRLAEAALTDPLEEDEARLVELAEEIERLRSALDAVDDRENEGAVRV